MAPKQESSEQPKRARMMGRIVGGVFIRSNGHQRRCFCRECLHDATSRAAEKQGWRA